MSHLQAYQSQSFEVSVELDLARIWEVEEIPQVKPMSNENVRYVGHYDTTTSTAASQRPQIMAADYGRIIVCLFFKSEAFKI